MPSWYYALQDKQADLRQKLQPLYEAAKANPSSVQLAYDPKWAGFGEQVADALSELLAIQYVVEHQEYQVPGTDKELSEEAVNQLILQRKEVLREKARLEDLKPTEITDLLGNVENRLDTVDGIKERFLRHTGRKDILTEDEAREDYYWRDTLRKQAESAVESRLASYNTSPEDAVGCLATMMAMEQIQVDRKASEQAVRQAMEEKRAQILKDPLFKVVTTNKTTEQMAALCGKKSPETGKLVLFNAAERENAFTKAVAATMVSSELTALRKSFQATPFKLQDARQHLRTVLTLNRVRNGNIKTKMPKWDFVTDESGRVRVNVSTTVSGWTEVSQVSKGYKESTRFNWITDKEDPTEFAQMLGGYDPEKKEFKTLKMKEVRQAYNLGQDRFNARYAELEKIWNEMDAAFSREDIDPEKAKDLLASVLALREIRDDLQSKDTPMADRIRQQQGRIKEDPVFQKAIENKSGKEIAQLCGKLDPESKKFVHLPQSYQIEDAYNRAYAARLVEEELGRFQESLVKEPFDAEKVRSHLATVLALNRVRTGSLQMPMAQSSEPWDRVTKQRDSTLSSPSFQWITGKGKEQLASMFGSIHPDTKEYQLLPLDAMLKNYGSVTNSMG